VERIVIRADGNPLFLEEMTRALLETDSDGASAMNKAALSSDVPFTLRTFVQARLDRLPKAKPIAQAAAVLGREFSLPLLQAVLEHSEDVSDELMRLVEREVLAPGPDRAAAVYRFKHALIQEAVYQTMLGNDRQRLHSRTADILVEHFAGRPESVPGILAHHLAMALRYADAASCLVQASSTTAARAAYLESIGHARAGLALVDKLQDAQQQRQLKRQLLTQLAIALAATSGYAAPEVETTYQEAAALCEENDDPAAVFPIVRGLGTFYFVRCNLLNADAVSLQCIELAKQAQRPDFLIEATSFRGYTSLYLGRIAEGREALEECVRLYRQHSGERFQYPSAQDAGTAAWSLLGIAAWLQGDTRRSDEAVAEALAHADKLGRTFDKAYAHVWIAMLRNMQRRFEEAAQHALACVEICSRDGFNTWLVAATMHSCISNCCRSAAPEAISTLQQALGAFIQAGAEANAPFFLWGIAHGHRYTGDLDNARSSLAEAKQRARATSELYLQSELLILEAEFDADPGRARVLLHEALRIAESQGAVVLALRAALGLLDPRFGERAASPLLHSARQALEGRAAYPQEHDWAVQALDEAKSMMSAAA
jgi:tetratricopeptide (TPR) repeat protein